LLSLIKKLDKNYIVHLLVNIFFVVFGLIFYFESFNIRRGFQQIVGANEYPRYVALFLVILGIINIIKSGIKYRAGEREVEELKIFKEFRVAGDKIIPLFLLLILNILLTRIIGYFESGFVFMFLAIFVLGPKTKISLLKALGFAIFITLILYLVFGIIMNIYLPPGLIF